MWSINFSNPVFLWLVVFIPIFIAAHFFFLKRTHAKALKFANFVALKRISGKRMVTTNVLILILRSLAILAFVLALSGATVWYDGMRNDFDYVLAIDTSSSMSARDISPSRLEAAKEAAITFLNSLDSTSKVGLVTFSGVTYVQRPLSDDHIALRFDLNNINLSRISGTDLSGAIVTSTNMFAQTDTAKAIILFTDGSDTVGSYLENNVLSASNYAASHHVVIHSIGLGTDNSPVGYLPEEFNLTVGIDKSALGLMSNITGGDVLYPSSTADLNSYFGELDSTAHNARIPFDLARYSLMFGFLLLIIEWILINLTFRRVV